MGPFNGGVLAHGSLAPFASAANREARNRLSYSREACLAVAISKDARSKRELVPMRWGLVPRWWGKSLKDVKMATFNARAETVETKPFFRDAFRRTRCLIPVSGYYEWQDTSQGKQPWYFTARDGSPVLTIAGLWDEWKNRETGERLKSCAMIITDPNQFVAQAHDRMPVLLKPAQFEHWLSVNMGVNELKPVENDYLQRWAVSKRINNSKADSNDPTLIDAVRQAP